jgi:hypothetical protein
MMTLWNHLLGCYHTTKSSHCSFYKVGSHSMDWKLPNSMRKQDEDILNPKTSRQSGTTISGCCSTITIESWNIYKTVDFLLRDFAHMLQQIWNYQQRTQEITLAEHNDEGNVTYFGHGGQHICQEKVWKWYRLHMSGNFSRLRKQMCTWQQNLPLLNIIPL